MSPRTKKSITSIDLLETSKGKIRIRYEGR